jgi:Fic family protein
MPQYDWLWTQVNWTDFQFDSALLQKYNSQFSFNALNNACPSIHFSDADHADNVKLMIQGFEAVTSSEIEGETLHINSVVGSMRQRFADVALHKPKGIDSEMRRSGIVSAMVDAYLHYDKPLSKGHLDHWNELLTETQAGELDVRGDYRQHKEPMTITSSARLDDDSATEINQNDFETREEYIESYLYEGSKAIPSYLAPPSDDVPELMDKFIDWFNDTAPNGDNPMPPVIRAALAHLHFVMIHPYEDGNGRMSRIIAEKALSSSVGQPTLISLSHRISQTKDEYYKHLENAARYGEIDGWMDYFCRTIVEAQQLTAQKIQSAKLEIEIKEQHYPYLNDRQTKLLDKMLNPSEPAFENGIDLKRYIGMSKNFFERGVDQKSKAELANQDLEHLVQIGVFEKAGTDKKTRYGLKGKISSPVLQRQLAAE